MPPPRRRPPRPRRPRPRRWRWHPRRPVGFRSECAISPTRARGSSASLGPSRGMLCVLQRSAAARPRRPRLPPPGLLAASPPLLPTCRTPQTAAQRRLGGVALPPQHQEFSVLINGRRGGHRSPRRTRRLGKTWTVGRSSASLCESLHRWGAPPPPPPPLPHTHTHIGATRVGVLR